MPMFKTGRGKIQDVKDTPKGKEASKEGVKSTRKFKPEPPKHPDTEQKSNG